MSIRKDTSIEEPNPQRSTHASSAPKQPAPPIGVTIFAVVVFAAAFMPWADIRTTSFSPFSPQLGMNSVDITGWKGTLTVLGVKVPNWLTFLAAAVIASMAWARAYSIWREPPFVSLVLATYGVLHVGTVVYTVMTSGRAGLGIGVVIAGVAFSWVLTLQVRELQARQRRMIIRSASASTES